MFEPLLVSWVCVPNSDGFTLLIKFSIAYGKLCGVEFRLPIK